VQVQARIFRPDSVPETAVTVWLDDEEIGQFIPTADWQTFTFTTTTPASTSEAELIFESSPFNPASLQISSDTRDLGFLIDSVHLQPLP
jgi:hypothetical protein